MWFSINPGTKLRPFKSTTLVSGPILLSTSARAPTRRIRFPRTQSASATSSLELTVMTLPLTNTVSAVGDVIIWISNSTLMIGCFLKNNPANLVDFRRQPTTVSRDKCSPNSARRPVSISAERKNSLMLARQRKLDDWHFCRDFWLVRYD